MKKTNLLLMPLFLIGGGLLTSCNSEPVVGPQGDQGIPGPTGEQGPTGQDGVSVVSIIKTSSDGLIDTYTITYSDGHTSTFTVTNGQNGAQGEQGIQGQPGEDGHTPVIAIGENGNWFIDGVDTNIASQGSKGERGNSVLTGHGEPSNNDGIIGDSYIDIDSWNYYVKEEDCWDFVGSIKGLNGETGTSITSAEIDVNGDLIVTFSNGQIINAGHVKNVNEYLVDFYCGDLLVDTQLVRHGEKISLPVLEDFTVKHWYLDKEFEYEWLWYGCVVTENLTLFGDYQPIEKTLSFDETTNIMIDSYGYGVTSNIGREICVSKATKTTEYLTTLQDRGILFNKSEIGLINSLVLNIEENGFSSAKLYYGNTPLSFEKSYDLLAGNNFLDLSGYEYFTVQNTGSDSINICSLTITYNKKAIYFDDNIPTVIINTINQQTVTSRTTYVDCSISTVGASKDVNNLEAQIKVRGNSTALRPKKPYRIKLKKKNSLFGYEKAKNWVLLADYMDGSNMHNYTALKFAKLVRGEESFGVNPLHVNVILNGVNVGLYLFGEHIDAKEGRLNIEQENIWEKEFDDINFYIERDLSTADDSLEVENETYFKIPLENYYLPQYVFALKYPEKEDFEEDMGDGTINYHEEEFQVFFNSLKDYMTDICNKFIPYLHNKNKFEDIAASVDVQSLAEYAVIDQAVNEADHAQKSFKMYRFNGGLLKFGPNWDYDSLAYGLPYQGTFVSSPFEVGSSNFDSLEFGELWGKMLFNDTTNGRPIFKNIWDSIAEEDLISFIDSQFCEINLISESAIYDCELWMNRQYYSLFDNQLYHWLFALNHLSFLKNYYA